MCCVVPPQCLCFPSVIAAIQGSLVKFLLVYFLLSEVAFESSYLYTYLSYFSRRIGTGVFFCSFSLCVCGNVLGSFKYLRLNT